MTSELDLKIESLELMLGLSSGKSASTDRSVEFRESCLQWSSADTTLYIGDNLKYLKEMACSTPEVVDLCYIDPPYNTGSKLMYNDRRKSKSVGVFGTHSAWLGFMLPRLVSARALLKDTGVIAISIDDYEYAHLKILMDNVFGEANFIGDVIVCRTKNGRGSKKNVAISHEHLLIYGKTKLAELRGQLDESKYNKRDSHGQYRTDGLFRKKGDASLRTDRPNLFYPLYCHPTNGEVSVDPIYGWQEVYPLDSKGIERRWLWSADTARNKAWQLSASKNGVVYIKTYSGTKGKVKRTKVRTLWTDSSFYTERGTDEIKELFGVKVFDTPKPLELIKKIIDVCANENSVVLDFFAGSGTTAHAVAQLNSEDNGSRQCILMESNHTIPYNHVAVEAGFGCISDITEYRLRLIKGLNVVDNFNYQTIGN